MSLFLDNAATSFPKPESVYRAMDTAMREIGVAPGRGGYRQSLAAARIVFETRSALADFFGVSDSSRLIFTHSATESLNLAVSGLLKPGDHVVSSSVEHNALLRPLHLMRQRGVEVSFVQAGPDSVVSEREIAAAMRPDTRLVALAHCSNVTGAAQPIAEIARIANPIETLLVADSLTGQDAVRTAKAFHERLPLTGLVLTRTDGDGRGGAALSMRAVTGLPIKFLGAGEKIDALELFDARRVAGRILGAGDVVALVERAAAEIDRGQAEKMARKMAKGQFDLDDLAEQLRQMQRMGGMQGILGMLPGVQKVKKQIAESGIDDKAFKRQEAIISSMTRLERKKPDILAASRKRRIAKGAGVDVAEVNRLLKQHRQMADMFKMMSRDGGKGMAKMAAMMGGMPGMPGGGGGGALPPGMGLPPGMSGPDLDKLKALGAGKPPASGGGGGLPGLGGFPGFKKK